MARKAVIEYVGDADSLIRATKKASGVTDKFAKQSGATWAKVGKTAALGAAAVTAGAVVIGKSLVSAASDAQVSGVKMQTQLKALGLSFDKHAEHIDKVIQKTSQLSGLDDEDLQDAFTNIVRTTKDVNSALKDTALASDIARAKHISLEAASKLVQKAEMGQVGALRKVGIESDKVTTASDKVKGSLTQWKAAHGKLTPEMAKHFDRLKDQAKASDLLATKTGAIGVLQKTFSGQAAAYGKTAAGAQERFGVAVENVKETLGSALLPTVAKVAGGVADFLSEMQNGEGTGGRFRAAVVDAFSSAKAAVITAISAVKGAFESVKATALELFRDFQEGKTAIAAIVGALAGLVVGLTAVKVYTTAVKGVALATKAWTIAQAAFNAVFIASPVGLIVVGLVALGAAVVLAYKKFETFRNIVDSAFAWIKGAVKNAIPTISAAFTSVKTVVGSVFNWLRTAFNNVVSWVKGAVAKVVHEVSEWKLLFAVVAAVWKVQFTIIKTYVQVAIAAIVLVVKAGIAVIKEVFREGMAVIAPVVKVALAVIVPLVKNAFGAIKTIISGAVSVIKGIIKVFGGVLKGDFGQIWDGVKEIFHGAVTALKGSVRLMTGGILGLLKALPGKMVDIAGNIISGLANGIRDKASDVINAIKEAITDRIPAFVKKQLHIESPSKVMAELGKQVAAGMAQGITDGRASVAAATRLGLLNPIDAAIAALNVQKDKLQKTWDAIDARAQRSTLLAAVAAAGRPTTASSGSRSTGGSSGSGGSVGTGVIGGGKFLQGLGLQVGESKYFGGVTTTRHAHYPNDHYSGNSIDVNAAGGGAAELSKLQAALTKLREKFRGSIVQAMIEDAGTANQHLHATFKTAGSAAKAAAATVKAAGAKVTAKATGKLTANQMRGLLYAAGFRGHDLDVAVAVGMAESSGNTKAEHKNSDGSTDRGFMQINSIHGALSTFDPVANAKAAKKIYDDAGGSFSPWVTFNTGAYNSHMGNVGSGSGTAMAKGSKGSASSKTSGGGSLAEAKKALAEFDKAAARTRKAARIDLQIKNLEQLKAFKDAIKGVRDRLTETAASAAAAWRAVREGEIDKTHDAAIAALSNTAQAKELAGIEDAEKADAIRKTEAGLDADLTSAKASGDKVAITAAEDAIAEYKRGKRADELRLWLENEAKKADDAQTTAKDGLDAEEADYKTSLSNRLTALGDNLEAGKVSYGDFVKAVQGELDGLHLPPGLPGFTSDAGEEGTIGAGAGPAGAPPVKGLPMTAAQVAAAAAAAASQQSSGNAAAEALRNAQKSKKRARGGPVTAGDSYFVGELGPEEFTPDQSGTITPNGRGKRGGIYMDFRGARIGSTKAARVMAERLSFRVAFG